MPGIERYTGALFVGVQSGYWRHWRGGARAGMWLLTHALLPSVSALLGYFPMKLLGQGEDLPGGVAAEWAGWCRNPRYAAGTIGPEGYAKLVAPIRSYWVSDDRYAPRPSGCCVSPDGSRAGPRTGYHAPEQEDPRMTSKPSSARLTGKALERALERALANRPEVLEAYLFGSEAQGRAQPHSDIDVALYVDTGRAGSSPYGYAAEITAHLMSALGSNEIDVVVLNRAPPVLYHRVLRDGRRVLTRDLRATTTREGYALSRYCDYVPQLAKIEAARRAAAVR